MNTKKLKPRLGDWITKQDAMDFLGYKSTQMNEFIRKHPMLEIARIGRRSFIKISSLLTVLDIYIEN